MTTHIRIAHSPDSDDAFMFYALAKNKIVHEGFSFEYILEDIEKLNQEAHKGTYEITAVSIHAYAYLSDKYSLLDSGASMGEKYGPLVIANESFDISELKNKTVAIPGTLTSAYLSLKLLQPEFHHKVVPFNHIIDEVKSGRVDAGLIIHEGQLQYKRENLKLIADLGNWWYDQYKLPLPLGGSAIRRNLDSETKKKLATLQKESIAYGLKHRQDALDYAMQYARDLPRTVADEFVGMYVNNRSLDYGQDGQEAVRKILDLAYQKKIIPHQVNVDFVSSN